MSSILNFLGSMAATSFRGLAPKRSYGRRVHSGSTFNAGRNAEKRKARAAQRKHRLDDLQTYASLQGTWAYVGATAPKHNCSARMHMLADRRLRQRGVVRG